MLLFNVFLLCIWSFGLSLVLFGTYRALRHLNQAPPHMDAPFGLYPVSVLKPVKGNEPLLKESLETFFHLDYPTYEIIFSVAHANDPARFVIERLCREYPGVPARLLIGEVKIGINPKVNNMVQSYKAARYDWILISDSNIRVKPDYLKRLVGHLDSGVGVLTAIVAGREARQLGGLLESTFLNTFYARWMILTSLFGRPCVVGKSMLFRKSTAERFGGLQTLAKYLAEDYMTGEAMQLLGYRVVVMHDVVEQPIGEYSFNSFWARHLRWGRIRKMHAPVAFVFEPWFNSLLSGVLGAISLNHFFGIDPYLLFSTHMLIWFVCDFLLLQRLEPEWGFRHLVAWLVRESLSFPQWIHTLCGNTIQWRGSQLRLKRGGLVESVEMATK